MADGGKLRYDAGIRIDEATGEGGGGLRGEQGGRFIVLEGPDGGGKTTQAARLAAWLGGLGLEVVACREPGGTALGDHLRSLVKDRSDLQIGMLAEMFLFMASRAQLLAEVVRPALDRGAVVVADRYLLSNVVYQGIAGGLGADALWNVGRVATGGVMPDLTLLLDVPVAVALDRVGPGRDRIEDRGVAYRQEVRDGYLRAVADYPSPIVVVEAARPLDAVTQIIQEEVARALAITPRP